MRVVRFEAELNAAGCHSRAAVVLPDGWCDNRHAFDCRLYAVLTSTRSGSPDRKGERLVTGQCACI